MTFETAPSAIDGAQLTAAMIRRAHYSDVGSNEGIVLKDDLKVTQLTVPGVGVQISTGVAYVANRYVSPVSQSYVVSNPTVHTVPSGDMPGSNPSTKYYLVCVVIGDPDFSQTGHPFMLPTDPPVGQELTFGYVRVRLIECGASDTKTTGAYPSLALARIAIPPSTTTITNAMITDLRKLARPRQEQQMFVGAPWLNASPRYIPAGGAYADWGAADYAPTVAVPSWAKRAIVVADVVGVRLADASVNVAGNIRTQLGAVVGTSVAFDIPSGTAGSLRMDLKTAGTYDVTSIAGTTVALRLEGYENVPASPTNAKRLALQTGSQLIFDVRFFEE